jgi:excisionase family DNA binding protein
VNLQHQTQTPSPPLDLTTSRSSEAAIDTVLTVHEVAHELKCSKAHVYNLINNRVAGVKPLPTISLGRKKLIRRSSFEAWKRANEANGLGATLAAEPNINTVDA